jgi:SAM-dependent methyltransferase
VLRHKLNRIARWLLRSGKIRALLCYIRFVWFVKLKKSLRTVSSHGAFPVTIDHNLKSLSDFRSSRMSLLLDPLAVIETVDPQSRILVIGCRNELDLLMLFAKGFSTRKVRGLDLISYSPFVDCGDMHSLPYSDDSFDVVICGWTLSYSRQPRVAAAEMKRVCRRGGVVAVAVEYCVDVAGVDSLRGYSISDGTGRKLNSVLDLQELFSVHEVQVVFRHDAPARRSHSAMGFVEHPSGVGLVFFNEKIDQSVGQET